MTRIWISLRCSDPVGDSLVMARCKIRGDEVSCSRVGCLDPEQSTCLSGGGRTLLCSVPLVCLSTPYLRS